MNKFLKRKSIVLQDSSHVQEIRVSNHFFKRNRIDLKTLLMNPKLRKNIS